MENNMNEVVEQLNNCHTTIYLMIEKLKYMTKDLKKESEKIDRINKNMESIIKNLRG